MASILRHADVRDALSLIEGARLPHPSGPLLSSFIVEALDPPLAARYILQTSQSGGGQEADLYQIVSDWSYLVQSSVYPTRLRGISCTMCTL